MRKDANYRLAVYNPYRVTQLLVANNNEFWYNFLGYTMK